MSLVKKLLIIIVLSILSTNIYAEETIRLASGEWSPYQSKNLKFFGVASRIVTEAFAMEKINVEYGYFPWSRSYKNAKSGEWDGTFLWFDTPERRNDFYISDPIIEIQYVFFHLKTNTFKWKTIDDLKGIFIGATLTYDYGELFQNAEKTGIIKVERVPKDILNFRKLLEGRIDIFPNDLDAGYEILNNQFTPKQIELFTYHPKPIKSAPHCLLLSKKITRNKSMIARFNRGLQLLIKSGKVDQYIMESRRGDYKK